ncbi:MAG: ATP-binding cassette domain-containing protein, partial [Chlorobiaceae bacterium]|nr:ATP-binding cassette domain-containing protein [Chlorobiaceae bacterium]
MGDQSRLLSVRDLRVEFSQKSQSGFGKPVPVKVVNGVSFDVLKGETLGLVGESGCGKTTLGRAIIRLGHPRVSGSIEFEGKEITSLGNRSFRTLRKDLQMIFQDPFGSLNPR